METISPDQAAQILERLKSKVITDWEAKVRNSISSAADESYSSLRDHLPMFIDGIIKALKSSLPGVSTEVLNVALMHGKDRAQFSNYSIEESLREYHLLRIVIFRALEKGKILSREARDVILNCLVLGLAKASEEFVKEQTKELETTQERLRAALHTSKIGVFDHNLLTNKIIWSPEEAMMFGLSPKKLTISYEDVRPRIHTKDIDKVEAAIQKSIKDETDFVSEFRVIWADGTIRWLKGAGRVLKDSEGIPVRMVGANIDITAERENSNQLRSTIEKLSQSEILREKFVSTLSHDLRTPLTTIKISAQLIQKKSPPELHSYCERIIKGAGRCDKLIQNLLDSNKLKAGHELAIDLNPNDLVSIAFDVVTEMKEVHFHEIEFIAPDSLPGLFSEDGMRRVLENLINNALKYGASDKPIRVTLNGDLEFLFISVQNFGDQIPEKELNKLFDAFHRTPSAERSGKVGWGIGLAIVKGIVNAHKGSISVKSSLEEGTEFLVTIPRHITLSPNKDNFGQNELR